MWSDVKYSIRSLLRSYGVCLTVIGVLGPCAALAATVFSVVDTVLLRPLPVRSPDQLRFVYSVDDSEAFTGVSYSSYERLRSLRGPEGVFDDLAVWGRDRARLSVSDFDDSLIAGEVVSANYFSVLGIAPRLGRTFEPEEDEPGAAPVAIISEELFAARFNSDPAILGRDVDLRPRSGGISKEPGRSYTIIGVMSRTFRGLANPLEPPQYWVPLRIRAADYACEDPRYLDGVSLTPFGRLNAGIADAASRVAAVSENVTSPRRRSLVLLENRRVNLPFDAVSTIVPENLAYALIGVCFVLLAIATTNLAGMLMARSIARRDEHTVRMMLGANPRRLMAIVFFETGLLATAGCAFGLWVAVLLARWFSVSVPLDFGSIVPRTVSVDVQVTLRTVLVMFPLAAVVTVAIALPTALQLTRTASLVGSGGAQAVAPRHLRSRLRWLVVFPQIVLAVMLLATAGVLVRTLAATQVSDQGFDSANLAFIEFELPRPGRCQMGDPGVSAAHAADRRRVVETLEREAVALAGVEEAAVAFLLPVNNLVRAHVQRHGAPATGGTVPMARADVGPNYFRTMRIPVLQGREFSEHDRREAPRVAVISRSIAEKLWPGASPIGDSIGLGDGNPTRSPQWSRIVGVVGDVAPAVIGHGPVSTVYVPASQSGWIRTVVVRYRGDPATVLRLLTRAARASDPDVEILRATTVDHVVAGIRYPRRVATGMLAVSGGSGVVLAAVGLFGLLAYSVRQRTREMGVRAALGAGKKSLAGVILKEGLGLGLAGAALGTLFAFLVGRVASRFLVPVADPDPITVLGTLLLVLALVAAASYLPARHASNVDPASVLRQQ